MRHEVGISNSQLVFERLNRVQNISKTYTAGSEGERVSIGDWCSSIRPKGAVTFVGLVNDPPKPHGERTLLPFLGPLSKVPLHHRREKTPHCTSCFPSNKNFTNTFNHLRKAHSLCSDASPRLPFWRFQRAGAPVMSLWHGIQRHTCVSQHGER